MGEEGPERGLVYTFPQPCKLDPILVGPKGKLGPAFKKKSGPKTRLESGTEEVIVPRKKSLVAQQWATIDRLRLGLRVN